MAHNQTNGALNGAPVPQENNLAPPAQETSALLKDRLAGIAHERHEKLKAEICKAIDGIFFYLSKDLYPSDTHTIEKPTLIFHKSFLST